MREAGVARTTWLAQRRGVSMPAKLSARGSRTHPDTWGRGIHQMVYAPVQPVAAARRSGSIMDSAPPSGRLTVSRDDVRPIRDFPETHSSLVQPDRTATTGD